MLSMKLIVFFSLLACNTASRASKESGLGYLFVNESQTAFCQELSPNNVCPPNLVNYKILGINRTTEAVVKAELADVNLALRSLDFFRQISQDCHDDVQEYSCSNTFAVCTPDSKYGVDLRYNYMKTKAACARVQKSCPKALADGLTFNCSLIQKDVSGYGYCVKLPEVPGDVCSKSSYTYPKALGVLYEATAKVFPKTLAELVKDKVFTSPICKNEFVDIYCQMLRGQICSTDMKLRMYAISQQDCVATYTKCLSSEVPLVQKFFLESCKLFPDASTSKRVPLPSGGNKI